jgi:tetratricopeptide (TPR) repeat protein
MSNKPNAIKPSHIAAAKLKVAIADRKGEEVPAWIRDLASRDISNPSVPPHRDQSSTTSGPPSALDPPVDPPDTAQEDPKQAVVSLPYWLATDSPLTQYWLTLAQMGANAPAGAGVLSAVAEGGADEAGNRLVTRRELAELLARQGRAEDAISVFRSRADTDDAYGAAHKLAELLARQGRADEAISVLRSRAEGGDRHAARNLADLLALQGHEDQAIAILQAAIEVSGHSNLTSREQPDTPE